MLDGGRREQLETELYVVPRDLPAPTLMAVVQKENLLNGMSHSTQSLASGYTDNPDSVSYSDNEQGISVKTQSNGKARLDNFAIYLQKDEPAFKGYIIVYAGQRARSGTAQVRAKRARDYLIKVHGIEAARIVTIDGECREKFAVEFYALPGSVSPPAPTPCRKE